MEHIRKCTKKYWYEFLRGDDQVVVIVTEMFYSVYSRIRAKLGLKPLEVGGKKEKKHTGKSSVIGGGVLIKIKNFLIKIVISQNISISHINKHKMCIVWNLF